MVSVAIAVTVAGVLGSDPLCPEGTELPGPRDLPASPALAFRGPDGRILGTAHSQPCPHGPGRSGAGPGQPSEPDACLGKGQKSSFLLSLWRPGWGLVARVKAALAPGARRPAWLTGWGRR